MTHICVGKLTIIGSDNGLSPGRRQAIIKTNAGILLIRTLGTNFSEILSKILTFSFKKMCLKVSSAKWRPFCLGLNVLTPRWHNMLKSVCWRDNDPCITCIQYYGCDSLAALADVASASVVLTYLFHNIAVAVPDGLITFSTEPCHWHVSYQPPGTQSHATGMYHINLLGHRAMPLACITSASWDTEPCHWHVSYQPPGTQNHATVMYHISLLRHRAMPLACIISASWDTEPCHWHVSY